MLDVSHWQSLLDEDTQRLAISRYPAYAFADDAVHQARRSQRVAAGLGVIERSTSD
ncbi:hypothetical protein [Nocardia sp. R6R-6]|uniref:hypothetical protein n=1 Tax=Nocardia sp. R6R-6 TaxID=3459303 RepID=UPI00403D840C